jgi:hypothetical protein
VSLHTVLQEKANILPSKNKMTNNTMPKLSQPSSQTTPPFNTANLAVYQRAMATSSSTTTSGGWVCGGEMNHRRPPPDPEQWNELMNRDQLAAEIEEVLRAASNAKKDKGN